MDFYHPRTLRVKDNTKGFLTNCSKLNISKASVEYEQITCVGDFLSCRLGLTLRNPLAARDELLASPFFKPSVTLRDRQESADYKNMLWGVLYFTSV